jgi:hypothetical protein
MARKDHPPYKMDEYNLETFEHPRSNREKAFRIDIIDKLPAYSYVGIIQRFAGYRIGVKLYSNGYYVLVLINNVVRKYGIDDVICDEIYEHERIRCQLSNEKFADGLPF